MLACLLCLSYPALEWKMESNRRQNRLCSMCLPGVRHHDLQTFLKTRKSFKQRNLQITARGFDSSLWPISWGESVNVSARSVRKRKRRGAPALTTCSLVSCNNTWRATDYLQPKSCPRDKYNYLMFLPTSFTFQRQYVEACISCALTWNQCCHPRTGCSEVLKNCLIIFQMFGK